MAASTLVQTRIDPVIKEKAARVLERAGLTVSDAVRILLTRTANEKKLPSLLTDEPEGYDAYVRAKVQEALDDPRPGIAHDEVKKEFARLRKELLVRSEAMAK
jgi:DNA-damage-inducible protein J